MRSSDEDVATVEEEFLDEGQLTGVLDDITICVSVVFAKMSKGISGVEKSGQIKNRSCRGSCARRRNDDVFLLFRGVV